MPSPNELLEGLGVNNPLIQSIAALATDCDSVGGRLYAPLYSEYLLEWLSKPDREGPSFFDSRRHIPKRGTASVTVPTMFWVLECAEAESIFRSRLVAAVQEANSHGVFARLDCFNPNFLEEAVGGSYDQMRRPWNPWIADREEYEDAEPPSALGEWDDEIFWGWDWDSEATYPYEGTAQFNQLHRDLPNHDGAKTGVLWQWLIPFLRRYSPALGVDPTTVDQVCVVTAEDEEQLASVVFILQNPEELPEGVELPDGGVMIDFFPI